MSSTKECKKMKQHCKTLRCRFGIDCVNQLKCTFEHSKEERLIFLEMEKQRLEHSGSRTKIPKKKPPGDKKTEDKIPQQKAEDKIPQQKAEDKIPKKKPPGKPHISMKDIDCKDGTLALCKRTQSNKRCDFKHSG